MDSTIPDLLFSSAKYIAKNYPQQECKIHTVVSGGGGGRGDRCLPGGCLPKGVSAQRG